MRVKSIDGYRDGGTIVARFEDGQAIYVDRRIGTLTPDAVYREYPEDGMEPLPGDNSFLVAAIEAAWAWHNRYSDERTSFRSQQLEETRDFEAYNAHRAKDLRHPFQQRVP